MTSRDGRYLEGLLAATVAVAEVTGKMRIDAMSDQMWKLIHDINVRLVALASAEANRLDDGR